MPALVTVMIPVYNGSKLLVKTIESLLKQTLDDFEVIFADDCSTDMSLEILRRYAALDARINVLTLENNLGNAPLVLNQIVKASTGKYLVYSSQDDFYSTDWLARMVARAEETGADAVIPDLTFYGGHSAGQSLVGVGGDRGILLSGLDALILSLEWAVHGYALWRASVVKQTMYPDEGAWADEYAVRLFFSKCRTVAFSSGTFYYRQDNPDAITRRFSIKSFDSSWSRLCVYDLLATVNCPPVVSSVFLMQTIRELYNLAYRVGELAPELRVQAFQKIGSCLRRVGIRNSVRLLRSRSLSLRDRGLLLLTIAPPLFSKIAFMTGRRAARC